MNKNILNPAICLCLGYIGAHFFESGNYDSVLLCLVTFVLWVSVYLEK